MIWCCPRCHGDLAPKPDTSLRCIDCGCDYSSVSGIPDLRVPGESWVDFSADLQSARQLAAQNLALPELVRALYAMRSGWTADQIELRIDQILSAPQKLSSDVSGWLRELVAGDGIVLDLGCGAGMLLAAMHQGRGKVGIGIDVSMTWLVAAQRLIADHGGDPVLAAALGESLPLKRESIDAVISLDVIEHVKDPRQYLREIDRVVRSGGQIALSSPNRFSLTAEPHVFLWGVGWLPRKWQEVYVEWRSGRPYDDTRLMSSRELRRCMTQNTSFRSRILIPPVPPEDVLRFHITKALFARIYNRLASSRLLRPLFLMVGPYFRVIGVKTAGAAPKHARA